MKRNNKGFTLAEMLIVVAIIGILISILTPNFTGKLETAREAADAANIRTAMSETNANYLLGKGTGLTQDVTITQTQTGWQSTITQIGGCEISKYVGLQMKDLTNVNTITVSCVGGSFSFTTSKK